MSRVLITGGRGFLGSQVAALTGGVVWDAAGENPVDLRNLPTFPSECRQVVHLAAVSSDPACRQDPGLAWDLNVTATVRLYLAAAAAGAELFVLASSEWVFAESPVARTEDDVPDATSLDTYGLTKWTAELALARVAQKSCPLLILRFGILYGERHPPIAAPEKVVSTVVRREPVTVGSKETGRCFLHVSDAAAAIAAALSQPVPGTYHLGGDFLTLGQIHQWTGTDQPLMETDPARPSIRKIDSTKFRRMFSWTPTPSEARIRALAAFYQSPTSHADA